MHFSTKTLLLGALAAICLTAPATAQVTVSIPANASVVSNTLNARVNNDVWWVCGSGNFTLQGNNNTVYGEPGARLTIDGNNNTVYSRSAVALTVTGNNNVIYSGARARVVVNGNNNVVHTANGADIQLNGQNNARQPLTSLAYSYANAGAGCRATATAEDVATAEGVTLAPNPLAAGGQLTITAPALPVAARIYDASGRAIRTWTEPTATLDLSGLPRGLYVVQVVLPTATVARRVVIE